LNNDDDLFQTVRDLWQSPGPRESFPEDSVRRIDPLPFFGFRCPDKDREEVSGGKGRPVLHDAYMRAR
jgi:hypothetical protein